MKHLAQGFSVENLDENQRAAFAMALAKRSTTTWSNLWLTNRHKLGCELIPCSALNEPMPQSISSDVEKVVVFRFSDFAPMIGFRRDDTFHIIWIDPKFKVYKH
jgi:hypothetical protein